jgi:hypothetical protein
MLYFYPNILNIIELSGQIDFLYTDFKKYSVNIKRQISKLQKMDVVESFTPMPYDRRRRIRCGTLPRLSLPPTSPTAVHKTSSSRRLYNHFYAPRMRTKHAVTTYSKCRFCYKIRQWRRTNFL